MQQQRDRYVYWFDDLGARDARLVGAKNASLGELVADLVGASVRVPYGFATALEAYRAFLERGGIADKITQDLRQIERGERTLEDGARAIRELFYGTDFPEDLAHAIERAYERLCAHYGVDRIDVAVRAGVIDPHNPELNFAGLNETFLNISGPSSVVAAVKGVYASLWTDRFLMFREQRGLGMDGIGMSCAVQKMVRSDKAGAGVMLTVDGETGFPDVVQISASWGLGEMVTQGAVNPDEYVVFKPLLEDESLAPVIDKTLGSKEKKMVYGTGGTRGIRRVETTKEERRSFVLGDSEVLRLARWGKALEEHYGQPMNVEWAKDGVSGQLFVVQADPEMRYAEPQDDVLTVFRLVEEAKPIISGSAVGDGIASGKVRCIASVEQADELEDGEVLVTETTDPDWIPLMRRAAAVVTDSGGRTSHAAIVSRELGVPAVVGTLNATELVMTGEEVTVSCAQGDAGHVYEGLVPFEKIQVSLEDLPNTRTKIMLNVASPGAAFRWWRLPVSGVGLARMEFIISNLIGIHPMALVKYREIDDPEICREIDEMTRGYADKTEYFVQRLAFGIARIAASQYPDPVIVRTSDLKSNEYADLIGGAQFEPDEKNPMLGLRGASRYYSERYRPGFELELAAIRRVRESMGLKNIIVMIPFCRTLAEQAMVLEVLEQNGLVRGKDGLEVYIMCEVPSNVVLAREFADLCDGFSIGSNDLTQLVLGVDRDAAELSYLFDERSEAVVRMMLILIERAHAGGSKVGICGEAPSDYPELAAFLAASGIDSVSLDPSSVLEVTRRIAEAEGGAGIRPGTERRRRPERRRPAQRRKAA